MRFITELSIKSPSLVTLWLMRLVNGIQLTAKQLEFISGVVRDKAPCRFLVFGLGNDSRYWAALNQGGVTAFLEDSDHWMERTSEVAAGMAVYKVRYGTARADWRMLLERPDLLEMQLPGEIGNHEWDIILVDGPRGWRDDQPGRMKSIYAASRLIGHSGDVFVHDCERTVENVYSNKFLGQENLKREIAGASGLLRHYRHAG